MALTVSFLDAAKPDSEILGGKGASLVEMTRLGMPVPPGFVLTTNAWRKYDETGSLPQELIDEVRQRLSELEKVTGHEFGSQTNPLLLSVRSGAKYSMPGMMDTILDVGVNSQIIPGLSNRIGGETFAWDTYRRFLKMFGSSVFGIHPGEFDLLNTDSNPQGAAQLYEKHIFLRTGNKIPQDPFAQLFQSIEAVFRSWYNPGAVAYRQINGIPDQIGTAVTIQTMVYGNNPDSGTGVLFTRDTTTGENKIIGDYLSNAQGEDIVRGATARLTVPIEQFAKERPEISKQLFSFAKQLEKVRKEAQDIEFTLEKDKLWLLQTRSAKRTPIANIRIAKEFYEEGIISEKDALKRIRPSDVEHVQLPTFDIQSELVAQEKALFASGTTASPGVATGYLVGTPEEVVKFKLENKSPILVCEHLDPNDVATLLQVSAVVTTRGSASSHMALIMRSAGLPGIVGAAQVQIDPKLRQTTSSGKTINFGEKISVNASKALIYVGELPIVPNPDIPADIIQLIDKRNSLYTRSPWSAGIYEEPSCPEIPSLVKKVTILREVASSRWQSEKARVIEVFDNFFDSQTMIKNRLFKPGDKDGLEKALLEVINGGDFNAPRTCHSPVKLAGAPWADGPNSLQAVEEFLIKPDYPGKYGGYPKWIEDPTLDAIIVSREPKDKLNPDFSNRHFVCTVSCINGVTSQLVININFGTAQLRSLERVVSSELATIRVNLDPQQNFSLGDKTYHLGRSYFDDGKIAKLTQIINTREVDHVEESLLRTKRHLLKQLTDDYSHVLNKKVEEEELKNIVYDLMTKGKLPVDVFRWVTSEHTLSLLDQIVKVIIDRWWKAPIYLPHVMSALDEVSGLSVLEAQGRFEEDKLIWFKIYGAKGSEERDKIKTWNNS